MVRRTHYPPAQLGPEEMESDGDGKRLCFMVRRTHYPPAQLGPEDME